MCKVLHHALVVFCAVAVAELCGVKPTLPEGSDDVAMPVFVGVQGSLNG